jgi:hypothetical protein
MKRVSVATYSAVIVLSLFGLGSAWVASAGDPHVGTWKLNLAKSKSDPPPTGPAPQSVTWKYEVFEGDGVKMTTDTLGADGKHAVAGYSAHADGKDYPYSGSTAIDAIVLKRVDAYSWDYTLKKGGAVVRSGRNTVSKDGKTITYTIKGTTANGQPLTATQVYEKQ